ncbi:O-antigen ligase family protein [Flammeovirga pacifica]|uniref:O-antigen ligase-related domain-containing protein n=1 Tax=Flammeovirga pacifica TaxID=915059 RepID=A0A1S1Z195_FLAPC|nr:O-antigen ligase family protein [Flammeovirga pacifica]OHX67011.1 hypothetical protein NH26_11985 [Flammeovirga pacifica]
MNININFSLKNNENKIYLLFILLFISLPLPILYSNIIIYSVSFLLIINGIRNYKSIDFYHPGFLFIFYFLLLCLNLLQVQEIEKYGIRRIDTSLPFLIIPLVFVLNNFFLKISNNKIIEILRVFSAFISGFVVICSIASIYKFITSEYLISNLFYNNYVSILSDFSPVYFGMYVCFSFVVLFIYPFSNKLLNNFLLSILSIGIIQTFSRINLLFFLLFLILNIKSFKVWLIIFFSIFISLFFLFESNLWNERVESVKKSITKSHYILTTEQFDPQQNISGEELRILHLRVFLENINSVKTLLIGNGTGMNEHTLAEKSFKYKREMTPHKTKYPYHEFNFHNSYLEIIFELGLIGVFPFIFYFKKLLNQRCKLNIYFVSLILIISLTESILMRQKGVVFVVFISSFLFLLNENSNIRYKRCS